MKPQIKRKRTVESKRCAYCGKQLAPGPHYEICCSLDCTMAYKKAQAQPIDAGADSFSDDLQPDHIKF